MFICTNILEIYLIIDNNKLKQELLSNKQDYNSYRANHIQDKVIVLNPELVGKCFIPYPEEKPLEYVKVVKLNTASYYVVVLHTVTIINGTKAVIQSEPFDWADHTNIKSVVNCKEAIARLKTER
jgi:hypothetical protein